MMTKRDLRLQVAKVTISVIGQNNDSNRSYNSWKTVQDKHHGESQIYMYSSLTKCDSVVGYITSERLGKLTKYLPDGIFLFFFIFENTFAPHWHFPRKVPIDSIEVPRKFPRSVVILDRNPFSKEISSYCTWIGEMKDRSQYTCNKQEMCMWT